MNRMFYVLFWLVILLNKVHVAQGCAQDSVLKKTSLEGYIKTLRLDDFESGFREKSSGYLLHNRIRIKTQLKDFLKIRLEVRNRIFYGENVRNDPQFISRLPYSSEYANLSATWWTGKSFAMYSNIDRLSIEIRRGDWDFKVGRQRINWGIGTFWNPNDLFNTYNFLDIDYEERPAADAALIRHQLNPTSTIEAAAAVNRRGQIITAARYYLNSGGTDYYVITGWYFDQPTFGWGWSGGLGSVGVKGEVQYYLKTDGTTNQLNIGLEADRTFQGNWYGSVGGLYLSDGAVSSLSNLTLATMEFSPKLIMPTRWNTFLFLSKGFSPLISMTGTVIYAPVSNLAILLGGFTFNIARELDLDLFTQSFFLEQKGAFKDYGHRMFLRLKWSF